MRKRDLRWKAESEVRGSGLPVRMAAEAHSGASFKDSIEPPTALPTISQLVRQVQLEQISIDRAVGLAAYRTELGLCNECDRKILDPEWGSLCDVCKEEE